MEEPREEVAKVLKKLLEAIVSWVVKDARSAPIPSLYESRVCYAKSPSEEIRMPAKLLEVGTADAMEIVVWRVAELRAQGENARVRVEWRHVWRGGRLYVAHYCTVRRGDGSVEDPVAEIVKRVST